MVRHCFIIILSIVLLLSCDAVAAEQKIVQIALSSSIKSPLESLCAKFADQTEYKCKIISASTGHLYAHIMHGAQYDLLIASNETYAQALVNAGKAERDNRFVLAIGRVVLWSADPTLTQQQIKEKLYDESTSIAIANPSSTPYGMAAKEILQGYNLWHRMQGRIIFGRNTKQTYGLVSRKQASIGFISLSQLSPAERAQKKFWEPDPNAYHPVLHEVLVLKPMMNKKATTAFTEFIQSRESCGVLQSAGYQCWAEYAFY